MADFKRTKKMETALKALKGIVGEGDRAVVIEPKVAVELRRWTKSPSRTWSVTSSVPHPTSKRDGMLGRQMETMTPQEGVMTPEEREAYYDAEIAPVLMDLGKACEERGLTLLAMCQWAPDEGGSTKGVPAGQRDCHVRSVMYAMEAKGNADLLFMALARDAKEQGHSSAVLKMLGVPSFLET